MCKKYLQRKETSIKWPQKQLNLIKKYLKKIKPLKKKNMHINFSEKK